jgi:hypothetical protein
MPKIQLSLCSIMFGLCLASLSATNLHCISVELCRSGHECQYGARCVSGYCQLASDSQENQPPEACIDANVRIIKDQRVTFSGLCSSDPDNDALRYHWIMLHKPEASQAKISNQDAPNASFIPDVYGEFVVRLTVSDSLGGEHSTEHRMQVNQPPHITPRENFDQIAVINSEVILNIDVHDPDSEDKLTYRWYIEHRPKDSKAVALPANSKESKFLADAEGIYVVKLRVSDGLEIAELIFSVRVIQPHDILPKLVSAVPNSISMRALTKVTLYGENIILGSLVTFNKSELQIDYKSQHEVSVMLDLRDVSQPNTYPISIAHPKGQRSNNLDIAVTPVVAPQISSIKPDVGIISKPITIYVSGTNFIADAKILIDGRKMNTQYIDSTLIYAEFTPNKVGHVIIQVENEATKRSAPKTFEIKELELKPKINRHAFSNAISNGYIDYKYEYLMLFVSGIDKTTKLFVQDQLYQGTTGFNLTPQSNSIMLPEFQYTGHKGYITFWLQNYNGDKLIKSETYRIQFIDFNVPSLSRINFIDTQGISSEHLFTHRKYKHIEISGHNFKQGILVFFNNRLYEGQVKLIDENTLHIPDFLTKHTTIGTNIFFVRNVVYNDAYASNVLHFKVMDGRRPHINTINTNNNTFLTNRTYQFLRITGENFFKGIELFINGIPINPEFIEVKDINLLYLHDFSTRLMKSGMQTIYLRNTISGEKFDSDISTIHLEDGLQPQILKVQILPQDDYEPVIHIGYSYNIKIIARNVSSDTQVWFGNSKYTGSIERIINDEISEISLRDYRTDLAEGEHFIKLRNEYIDSNHYRFVVKTLAPPVVIGISHQNVSHSFVDKFTVYGNRFHRNASLLLNGQPIPILDLKPTSITAILNAAQFKVGIVRIEVQNADGQKSNQYFLYLGLGPIITNVLTREIERIADPAHHYSISVHFTGYNLQQGANIYWHDKFIGTLQVITHGFSSDFVAYLNIGQIPFSTKEIEIHILNPDGQKSNTITIYIDGSDKPEILRLSPDYISSPYYGNLYIGGRGFAPDSDVLINGESLTKKYQRKIIYDPTRPTTLGVDLSNLNLSGRYAIEVQNSNGKKSHPYYILYNCSPPPILIQSVISEDSNAYSHKDGCLDFLVDGISRNSGNLTVWINNTKYEHHNLYMNNIIRIAVAYPISKMVHGEYLHFHLEENGHLSNTYGIKIYSKPLIKNIYPPMLQYNTMNQTLTIGLDFLPEINIEIFGKRYPFKMNDSSKSVSIDLTDELKNRPSGIYDIYVENAFTGDKAKTGIQVIDP